MAEDESTPREVMASHPDAVAHFNALLGYVRLKWAFLIFLVSFIIGVCSSALYFHTTFGNETRAAAKEAARNEFNEFRDEFTKLKDTIEKKVNSRLEEHTRDMLGYTISSDPDALMRLFTDNLAVVATGQSGNTTVYDNAIWRVSKVLDAASGTSHFQRLSSQLAPYLDALRLDQPVAENSDSLRPRLLIFRYIVEGGTQDLRNKASEIVSTKRSAIAHVLKDCYANDPGRQAEATKFYDQLLHVIDASPAAP